MRIRSYGARGSVPVSGKDYLKYGGDTTCVEILTGSGETIVVDAGSGMRRLGDRLIAENRLQFHLLFTHFHWDHIIGFTVFKPNYLEATRTNIWHPRQIQGDIRATLKNLMSPPGFPIRYSRLNATHMFQQHDMRSFGIAMTSVHTIAISHTHPGLGYRFEENGKSFVILTDNELGRQHPGGQPFEDYVTFAREADLMFHDAQYTRQEYPSKAGRGHSSVTDALDLALKAGVHRFGLFHHSPDRTDAALDALVADCRARIAEAGSPMTCFAVGQDTDITL
ncbi:MAG: MBL fold metallo-hydrolase [Pseudomonadota bacterium]